MSTLRHILRSPAVRIALLTLIAFLLWTAALPVLAAVQSENSSITTGGLQNPLKFPNIQKFIEGVLQAIVMIALPIITIFVVYAGFKYISARGNISKIGEAHKNFQYVIIGTILILSAWVLATLIGGTVTQLLG
ncbi:hypothetical protein A2765_06345 [Candidatus Kaiserbacteria bacterium RIFCSPHIGHO2_01_FULL_56_24]|uniref:Uncharacterized protein n=1 Tax=Candidatus Kaiserbacteria bacterium RIFCSPHIGHO2_01_FULL_56_24 TaxID=1798487 RepID=A0A1F6DG51_9BACT|nr:MAG: hypothetical protein A2765_06345 [Candidatus Kaiserbacteria bacterium RIFCSPHIGHO2_01_FULL_56_24]